MAYDRTERRSRIHRGIRKKITGSGERPRLSVFRSNTEIYAQIIDDIQGLPCVLPPPARSPSRE